MELVQLESPFAGWGQTELERKACEQANIEYARRCMSHCLVHREAPFASHLLYTQDNVLDDDVEKERRLGIEAGLQWGHHADKSVVYIDRGFTKGMAQGLRRAFAENRPFELRTHPHYTKASTILIACYRFSNARKHDCFAANFDPRDSFAQYDHYHPENDPVAHTALLEASSEFDGDIVEFLAHLQETYV